MGERGSIIHQLVIPEVGDRGLVEGQYSKT